MKSLFPFIDQRNSFYKGRQCTNESSGQIVVEYILLLVVCVGVAILMTTTLVSRSPENPGFLVVKWVDIIQTIGKDVVDE